MEFALPEIGEGVYEAELVRWLVGPGETVKRGQNLLEVMTDKATMEIPTPFVGTVDALRAEPGQTVKVGQVVLDYTPAGQTAEPAPAPRVQESPPAAAVPARVTVNGPVAVAPTPLFVKAAPSVRQMARKLGVDLATVSGSGPEGRILIDDLSRHVHASVGRDMPPARRPEPKLDFGTPGGRIKLVGLRRRVAEHMVRAKSTIPHYSYVDECEVTELVRLRNNLKEAYARAGVKLTYLPFFVKAVVAALKQVPIVNASLDESAGEIVLHDRYHVGIAVATPGGLIVPVVHDADRKDIGTLAREIDRLSAEARAARPRLEDLRGGTFTITSVGNIGGLFSAPVINHPEVGILGIGKVVRRPVFDEHDQVRPAEIVYLSASFDHRVVDGAVGAAFTNVIIRHLSNPALLLLPEKL
jgi:pyruvate dehydrogenase E2 component (dihydrolipoamide acetyltransferase)/2-oxoisovalerate dehydrogenase E2 component (dihydrolipoyl transacylase)